MPCEPISVGNAQFENRPGDAVPVDTMPEWAARHFARRRKVPRWRVRLASALAYLPVLSGISALALTLAPHGAHAHAAADAGGALDAGPEPDPAGSSGFPSSPGVAAAGGGWWSLHGQSTLIAQGMVEAHLPSAGPDAPKRGDLRETWDATAFIGAAPWRGAEFWANLEVDQGFGLGDALGAAGDSNGDSYSVGRANPYLRLQRLYFRQTVGLGGDNVPVASGPNQMAGYQRANRIVLTIGKFGASDVFDTNRYAHDPRGDFLNWAVIESGAFDFGADPWGYSYGGTVEAYAGQWTLRGGAFNLSKEPGGTGLGVGFGQYQALGEVEHRHAIGGHAGALRAGVWRSHGRFGRFDEAIGWGLGHGVAPDTGQVARMANRWGGYLNVEQELSPALGGFLRISAANGAIAAYEFADIDRSVSGGLVLSGAVWRRPLDSAALAFAVNDVSGVMKRYLAAGGAGGVPGDGTIAHAGAERMVEAYYCWHPSGALLGGAVAVTVDYQLVVNPAYNRDRGPAHVLGLRVHWGV